MLYAHGEEQFESLRRVFRLRENWAIPQIRMSNNLSTDINPDAPAAKPGGVWGMLALLTLLAAALRAFKLDNGGLWYDELIMVRLTSGSFSEIWSDIVEGRPALYPLLAWAWEAVLGNGDHAVRSLSAILGTLTVPMIFLAGRRLFDHRVGLLAALFCAVSPFEVYYSQEHRYYALLLLLATFSIWSLLLSLDWQGTSNPRPHRARPWAWRGYVVSSVLMFYTHPISACLLFSMGVGVLAVGFTGGLQPGQLKRFIISQCAILGVILPWLVVPIMQMARHVEAPTNLSGPSAGTEAVGAFVPWIGPTPWWTPIRTVLNFLFLGKRFVRMDFAALGVVVLCLGVVWAFLRRGTFRPSGQGLRSLWRAGQSWWMGLCWATGAILITAAVSWTVKPIYVDRYVIVTAAGLYVLIAAALIAVRRWVPVWAGSGLLVLVMAGALWSYYEDPQKGAWREAAHWLDEHLQPGDVLAFTSERGSPTETEHVRENWFWYAQNPGQIPPVDIYVRDEPARVIQSLAEVLNTAESLALNNTGVRELEPVSVNPAAGVWLVMWRDPDRPVGFDEWFADGAFGGLTIDRSQVFFDLVLTRLVKASTPVVSDDSPPILP